MTLRKLILTISAAACCMTALAGPVDDARKLYADGKYDAVIEKLKPVVKRTPKDGNATFFLGASYYALGNTDDARQPLTVAESRGVPEASRMLAEMSLDRYDTEAARLHIEKWETSLKKQKKSIPDSHSELTSRLVMMSNMLERVEKIEVLDSITVDRATFFNAYMLSPTAGRILPPDAVSRIGAGNTSSELSTAYIPENNSEIIWAATDSTGLYRLYGADILDDGTVDHSAPLDNSLGDGGDARYPFLMPDGMTLYFAANGNGSLGGYDIFMTRRSEGDDGREYFQPQNVGMPYNSPYDDYLLAIDEASGLGWWATDRNRIPDKVTIYIFAPSQMRVNADPSDPDIEALARLSDISLTQRPDVDYKELLASKLPARDASGETIAAASPRFMLDMGNGKVYSALSDFRNDRARSAMLEALAAEASLRKHLVKENELRERYRKGDRSVADAILDSERETTRLRERIRSQRNAAVRQER